MKKFTSGKALYNELKKAAIFTLCVILFCEWLLYYVVIFQCSWPEIKPGQNSKHETLKVLLLSDTHLLGSQDGHWFDKLRREWQMERAFQTALSRFRPDVVFLLGDLFDEGMKCSDEEWDLYVQRFNKMFRHPEDTQVLVVVGNHDIGFHPRASSDRQLFKRFSSEFDSPSVQLLTIKGNIFVLVNSIALQGDDCVMCSEAMAQLKSVADKLMCPHKKFNMDNYRNLGGKSDTNCELPHDAPAPILIQHFPLYRPTESVCTGVDAPPSADRDSPNREKWEVVSKDMSHQLLSLLKPRLVFSGHTHHGCYVEHDNGTPELTIPSFSWRNRNNPSFILGIITTDDFSLSKCFIPRESTVITIYVLAGVSFLLTHLRLACLGLNTRRKYT